ncbi:SufD family Fe-S cluster assembly protein, partial [Candidatus Woesearchaeota archaeon]
MERQTHITTPTGSWNALRFSWDGEREPAPDIHVALSSGEKPGEAVIVTAEPPPQTHASKDAIRYEHERRCTGALHITVTRTLDKPLIITHVLTKDAFHDTTLTIEPGVNCVIIERFTGDARLASHYAELLVGEHAHVHYAQLQAMRGTILTRKRGRLARAATLTLFELNATTGSTYSRAETSLVGEGAGTKMLSIYLGDNDLIDYGATATHDAAHTTSNLLTRGVLRGKSLAIYEGTLRINNAPKSEAFQQEDCLLMSPDAEVKASPRLYINHDDVRCSHAATASRIDDEKRFYLTSRGLTDDEAAKLLTRAFVWPVLEQLDGAAAHHITGMAEPILKR